MPRICYKMDKQLLIYYFLLFVAGFLLGYMIAGNVIESDLGYCKDAYDKCRDKYLDCARSNDITNFDILGLNITWSDING